MDTRLVYRTCDVKLDCIQTRMGKCFSDDKQPHKQQILDLHSFNILFIMNYNTSSKAGCVT